MPAKFYINSILLLFPIVFVMGAENYIDYRGMLNDASNLVV